MEKVTIQMGATITEFETSYAMAKSVLQLMKHTNCKYTERKDEELIAKWQEQIMQPAPKR